MNIEHAPHYLSLYQPTPDEIDETRALFASTIHGREALARRGFSVAEIDALAARHQEPGTAARPKPATTPPAAAKPRSALPTFTAPSFPVTPPPSAPAPTTFPATPEGWRAEFAASADLQAEFPSADRYANYMAGVASGRIRIVGGRTISGDRAVSTLGRAARSTPGGAR